MKASAWHFRDQPTVTGLWQQEELEKEAGPPIRDLKDHSVIVNLSGTAAGCLSKIRCVFEKTGSGFRGAGVSERNTVGDCKGNLGI